jgi:type I restriction enzyme S subunit
VNDLTRDRATPIAKGWRWCKFGECATLINGRAYSQDELLDSGTPVLRIQNLNGGERWYYSDLELPKEKYCVAGDLLYAWSATFGPYRFEGPRSIFHYHIWRVIPGDRLDKNFAFHLLGWMTARIRAAAHGVAMLHMTKGGMEAWPIPVPPLDEQRRIAAILDRAEALEAMRLNAIATVDMLPPAMFAALFGDAASNSGNWPVRTLAEVTTDIYRYPSYYNISYVGQGVPEVRGELINPDGTIAQEPSRLRFISPATSAKFPRTVLSEGDLVMSVRGTIGKFGVVPPALAGANITANLIRIALNRQLVDPEFAWHSTQTAHFKMQLSRACAKTTIQTIKAADLKCLSMAVPPMELQQKFAGQVAAVAQLARKQAASLESQKALFLSLQHRAFRGEL